MSRIPELGAWLFGAAISALAFWSVVVYAFDEFDRGYGRDTWFALNVYVSFLSILIGLIGYGAVVFFRARARSFGAACVAGVAFTIGELLFVYVLGRAYPDRDIASEQLAGALVVGALSTFAVWRDER